MAGYPNDIRVVDLFEAARRSDVSEVMRQFYAEADGRIAEQAATCWNKGQCCRFGEFGHRLYVTAMEVAYYLGGCDAPAHAGRLNRPHATIPVVTEDVCPHAYGGTCHARDRRPLGCRIFFCDLAAQQWQSPLMETLLARLRVLHDTLGVRYFYADWMIVLRAVGQQAAR